MLFILSAEEAVFIRLMLGLHDAICLTDSVVFNPDHSVNLEVMNCESTSLNKIVDDKLHRIVLDPVELHL